jgi:hypothetical protein
MENIFAPDPQFKQGQYQKLSDNSNEWEEQIYSTLAVIIPRELGLSTTLHWQKIDDQQGYAIGSVILAGSKQGSVGIPIIIKQWHLAPMDVMMLDDDHSYPLTPDTLSEVFSGSAIATETISRQGRDSIVGFGGDQQEATRPPLGGGGGRYSYSSAADLLEEAVATAYEEDLQRFRKTAMNESIMSAIAKNGHYDKFSKIASKNGKTAKKAVRKHSIINVQKNGVNEYSILGNPEGVFDPLMSTVNRKDMCGLVSNVVGPGEAESEAVSRVDKNQSVQISAPKINIGSTVKDSVGEDLGQRGKIFLYEEGTSDAKPCDKFGLYGVKDSAGVVSYGYVFTNVIDFNKKKLGIKLFVGKNASAAQSQIAGISEPNREVELPTTEMEPGKLGTLVFIENGNALATFPFRVVSKQWKGGSETFFVKDYFGHDTTLVMSSMAEGITKFEKSKSMGPMKGAIYSVPSKMKFLAMGPTKQLPVSPADYKKHAALDNDSNPLKILRSNDKFVFKGPDLRKYANVNNIRFDFQNLARPEAEFLLCSFGCPIEKCASALDRASYFKEIQVHGLTFPKVASEIVEDTRLSRFISSLKCDLIKEAAVMDDAEIVDTALSLGFINPDNINQFTRAIPNMKECLSLLSKMLVASRLGMYNIPEEAAQSAIQNILRVIGGLRKLSLMNSGRPI